MILIDNSRKEYNQEEIFRGVLICARHKSWPEWQSGIVTDVSGRVIRVQYLPSIQNVQNHYFIPAEEVENGEWEIRYSSDNLVSVKAYPEKQEEVPPEDTGDVNEEDTGGNMDGSE